MILKWTPRFLNSIFHTLSWSVLLLLLPFIVKGQSTFALTGKITDASDNPIPYANIGLENTNKQTTTNEQGQFTLNEIPAGEYTVIVNAADYKVWSEKVIIKEDYRLSITLQSNETALDDVTIVGKTASRELNEDPMAINSLSTQPVLDQAMGAEELLKTSTGVVVRQTGGLGSSLNINLNGLSGQAVRVYFDGIPLEVFGGGIQLNTIPVDVIDRIDVYKGVMPIDVGTDALAGGINLVPAKKDYNFLRTSYSFGSFNTHRFTLNASKNISEHFGIAALAYFNYSDNDFEMRNIRSVTERTLPNGTIVAGPEETINARRFHDRHISAYAEAAFKLYDLSWVDRLEFASSFARRDDEIQQGAFIFNTAVGEAEYDVNTFIQRLDYRKTFLKGKLDTRYYGVLSLAQDQIRDSTQAIYNWRGEQLQTVNNSGAEVFAEPILREGENLGTSHRLVLRYEINKWLNFTLSEFFRYTRIEGRDPANPGINIGEGEPVDPNTVPSTLRRNIVGAELSADFFEEKLTTVVFFKNYDYNAESIDFLQTTATVLPVREIQENNNGYGLALKYQFHPKVFIRTSFERAVRIPTEREIFGDFASIVPNFELRPEKSNNINVGLLYSNTLAGSRELFLRVDGFIRNREDLIRPDAFGPENIIFINEAAVDGEGIELSARFSPVKKLNLSGNFTYQSSEIASSSSAATGSIGAQVPNQPLLFYNLGARYTIENVLKASNSLEVFWDYFFIDRFSINEVQDLDTANPLFIVPAQNVHNTGLIYRLPEEGLSFSFSLQNVFNAEVFDNFRIPRPGINYQIKVNYSL
ncbi:MAG: TonB-dependent receptor [Thermonemataceae bacterium]